MNLSHLNYAMLSLVLGMASFHCQAQTVKVTIDSTTVKAWLPGEQPAIALRFDNAAQPRRVPITINLATDAGEPYASLTVRPLVPKGHSHCQSLALPALEPGFYRMTITADGTKVCALNVGYDPEHIVSPYDAQPDFAQFWDNALKELAGVKPHYKMVREVKEKSTAARRVYIVEMKSVPDSLGGKPVTVRAYYAEPRKPGKYPALIHFPGTDGGTGDPWCMGGDDNPELVELIVSVRGQCINNRPPYKAEGARYGHDYYTVGFGHLRNHYYYGAYLDCVRAIDFLDSRTKVDRSRIYANGYSQGGAHTLVAAALGKGRIAAAAPAITGHADFPDDLKVAAWPANIFAKKQAETGLSDEEMLRWLTYFDVKNFAPMVTCPVITSLSLQDTTDPPHVGFAPYNLLGTPAQNKRYILNPLLGHSMAPDWWQQFSTFLGLK